MADSIYSDLLIPARSKLFHIGLMKTGTTSLQNAASSLRPQLLSQGVRYPGTSVNHRTALLSVMGRGWGWDGKPRPEAWVRLKEEMEAETSRRIWIGHELVAGADDATVETFRKQLGGDVHVVITLRNYASVLPSVWQQRLKSGNTGEFESWLRSVLSEVPQNKFELNQRAPHDQGQVVTRWAKEFGRENVTVVVVDKSMPSLIFDAFEGMLGLEPGLLASADPDVMAANPSNRGMSLEEAEFLRALNSRLRDDLTWPEYRRWLRTAVAGSMLAHRVPGTNDTRLVLPSWAAEKAVARSQQFVEQIDESGVRVVGDLRLLTEPVPSPEDSLVRADRLALDAAVEAVLGVVAEGRVAARQAAKFERKARRRTTIASPGLGDVSGHALLAELKRRVRNRLLGGSNSK